MSEKFEQAVLRSYYHHYIIDVMSSNSRDDIKSDEDAAVLQIILDYGPFVVVTDEGSIPFPTKRP